MHLSVLPACISVYCVFVYLVPVEPRRDIKSAEIRVTDSCELLLWVLGIESASSKCS